MNNLVKCLFFCVGPSFRKAHSVCTCNYFVYVCVYTTYLCRKMVYDGYRDAGITGGCSQRDTESVRYKHLETSLCTDLDKSTATVTTNLEETKHTWSYKTILKQKHRYTRTNV